jgi:NitT/TauT family transport system ATP-binding protein
MPFIGVPERCGNLENHMLLELKNIDFGFRQEAPILKGFDMNVAQGEFLALLGPSGCGKSTMLNLAAGLLLPLAGSVKFNGAYLHGINKNVGYMTQGDTLLPWNTVAKNILLPLELRGVSKQERSDKLEHALKLVNLVEARDKYPSELSGGMKRRALLARSLIYSPPMLLMDEPFAALDAQLRETMHQELLNTVNRLNESVLFVTHDISESILLADRVLVLGGRPLRILEEITIPWGKERRLDIIRDSKEYAALEAHVRGLLRQADAVQYPATARSA